MTANLLVNVRGGARIRVPATLSNITTFVLLEQETWFEDELGFVRSCTGRGQTAVDVGANLGVYTTTLAAGVGGGGRVLAFEPAAATAALLRRTLAEGSYGCVALLQAAVSDHGGHAVLEIGDSPELNALTETPRAGRATERVELLTLDETLRAMGLDSLAFLKIDAEGHELPVMRGGVRALKACEPLVMFEIAHGGAFDFRLLEYFEAQGCDAYRLIPGLGVLAPFTREEAPDPFQLNLFACGPGRATCLQEGGLLVARSASCDVTPAPSAEAARYLTSLPGGWRGSPMDGPYAKALAHIAAVQTAALSPDEELAHLVQARRWSAESLRERASLARTLTHARLCADLGWRTAAVDAIKGLVDRVLDAGRLPLEEPCLPPVARYASLDPGSDPTEWLQCLAVEAFLRFAMFSSYFVDPASVLPLLDYLRPRRYYCAEMERRRQLLLMGTGRQHRPEPHALLARQSPDNLNPWFWAGE